jgi:hypothetical protein
MLKQKLYEKTVDILVQAYFNDTLMHNTCSACAVGNIIAANVGSEVIINSTYNRGAWIPKKEIRWHEIIQLGRVVGYDKAIVSKMGKSGYTIYELAKIETAFENADAPNGKIDRDDAWMFNGLMAVIDVLDEIHENKDEHITTTQKQKFKKELV